MFFQTVWSYPPGNDNVEFPNKGWCWQGRSLNKGPCCQVQQPEVDLGIHMVEEERQVLQGVLWHPHVTYTTPMKTLISAITSFITREFSSRNETLRWWQIATRGIVWYLIQPVSSHPEFQRHTLGVKYDAWGLLKHWISISAAALTVSRELDMYLRGVTGHKQLS